MTRRTRDVTVPDPGDILFPRIPVEAIMAYSVGRLPDFVAEGFRVTPPPLPDDTFVRVAKVKVDGVWVEL